MNSGRPVMLSDQVLRVLRSCLGLLRRRPDSDLHESVDHLCQLWRRLQFGLSGQL